MSDNIQEKIENKIIDLIALGATGRLIVFKPENINIPQQAGKDLVVEKKGNYKKTPIFLKIYDKELFDKVSADKDKSLYLIFTHFDAIKQDIEDEIFIVSPDDFKKVTMDKKDFGKFLIEELEKK